MLMRFLFKWKILMIVKRFPSSLARSFFFLCHFEFFIANWSWHEFLLFFRLPSDNLWEACSEYFSRAEALISFFFFFYISHIDKSSIRSDNDHSIRSVTSVKCKTSRWSLRSDQNSLKNETRNERRLLTGDIYPEELSLTFLKFSFDYEENRDIFSSFNRDVAL